MRVSSQQLFALGVRDLVSGQGALVRTRERIATGERIATPSDDPAGAARVLELDRALAAVAQFDQNAAVVEGRLAQEEDALRNVEVLLTRVRELALRGRNESLSDADRSFIAAEVGQRLDELKALANTRDANGEYIFAGFRSRTRPFTDSASGVVYQGDQGQRVLQLSPERRVPDRDSGQDLFMAIRNGNGQFVADATSTNAGTGVVSPGSVTDPAAFQRHDYRIVFTTPSSYDVIDDTAGATVASAQPYSEGAAITFAGIEVSVRGQPAAGDTFTIRPSANQSLFATVDSLRQALLTGTGAAVDEARFEQRIERALSDLDRGIDHVVEARTTVGARLASIDTQRNVNEDLKVHLATVRSRIQDTDLATAAIELNRQLAALQAAQLAFVRTQNLSLFNFL